MMSESKKMRLYKYSTVLGSFVIVMGSSLHWYWGNLAVYLSSYDRVKHNIKTKVLSAWTLALYLVMWSVVMNIVQPIHKRIGTRWTMLIGIILTEAGFLLGLLSVIHPEIPLEIGFGLFCGAGTSFTHSIGLVAVLEWADENQGVLGSCVQAGFSFGGLVINQAISWYINPENEKPITVGDYMPFFNQEYVNDRVGEYLIIYIVTSSAICLVGLALIRKRPKTKPTDTADNGHQIQPTHIAGNENSEATETTHIVKKPKVPDLEIVEEQPPDKVQYTALSLLKSKAFYALAYCLVNGDITFVTASTYYKEFGLTRINDDHFLSLAGTVPQFFNLAMTLATGALMDRFGTKNILALYCLILTISFAFIFFSPLGGKWLFFLLVQFCVGVADTLYSAPVIALIKMFGECELPRKLSFLFAFTAISTLVVPTILKSLIFSYGWFGLFCFSSATSLLAVILIAIFLPHRD